jgi:hypothetical protein
MGIPSPEPGLVLHYAYLWHDEFRVGKEEGRKNRPTVIVLSSLRGKDGATYVIVLPITHSAPGDPQSAIEIPPRVKQHLGLDDSRSWIVVAEGNGFIWPGYDLRKAPGTDQYAYGFLPPRFFLQVRNAFAALHSAGKAVTSPRT